MLRALFEKTGYAVYISHLDLMRLFHRAFQRAGFSLTHTQGFNPRPTVSIALPLSVGVESRCELLDFDLNGTLPSLEEMRDRLNHALVDGIRVLQVYYAERKTKEISLLDCTITMEYDCMVTQDAIYELEKLFQRESLPVEKKGKNVVTMQDIIPLIKRMQISAINEHSLQIVARINCQNPTLNPAQILAAIRQYRSELIPSFISYRRDEIYDQSEEIFR